MVVSYIGMQEQKVTIRPNLKVMMKANTELLDEVVVTAYGTAKRSSFTGSASVVSSEEIGKIQTSNVANALNGKVSGVQLNNASGQPGSNSPSIRIRGISSINAENDPLVILDGVPYDGDLNNLEEKMLVTMSCKAAVKAGAELNLWQMEELIKKWKTTKMPYTCPHGRPIVHSFSEKEIAAFFHRNA